MTPKHLLSVAQLEPAELLHLVQLANEYASGSNSGQKPLSGKLVGLYFRRTSTRTRTSFTAAALKLGAQTLSFGPDDLQINTGETLRDTGRVLAGYIDALVVRTNDDVLEMEELAAQNQMAVINAMSAQEHPTQSVADLSVLNEHFGSLEGLHILYVGEGNNTAAALALAVGLLPSMRLTLVTPEGFGLPAEVVGQASARGGPLGTRIEQHHRVTDLPSNVDAVYATRWQTMGSPKSAPGWKERFAPLCVDEGLMARVSKPNGTVFLHDLPAVRGEDVSEAVLEGPQSLAWRQAKHKLYAAMAVLDWSLTS